MEEGTGGEEDEGEGEEAMVEFALLLLLPWGVFLPAMVGLLSRQGLRKGLGSGYGSAMFGNWKSLGAVGTVDRKWSA